MPNQTGERTSAQRRPGVWQRRGFVAACVMAACMTLGLRLSPAHSQEQGPFPQQGPFPRTLPAIQVPGVGSAALNGFQQPVMFQDAGKGKIEQLPEKGKGAEEGPAPKPFEPFGPKRPRLPRLPGVPGPLGGTPVPSARQLDEFNRYVDKFVDPQNVLDMIVNRPRLIVLKETPKRVQIADEKVANYNILSPKEITVLGKQVGTTVLNLWFADPADAAKEKVLSYLVRVLPDPEAKERLERIYEALADEINRTFPDSYVQLRMVGDKLVVSGQAKDIFEGTQILRIIRANAPPEEQTRIPVDNVNLMLRPGDIGAVGGVPGLENFLLAGGPNVINLMRIPGEQQVMLKVTVAEINRAAARSIGLNFSLTNNQGVTYFQNRTGNISTGGVAGALAGLAGAGLGDVTNNLPTLLDNGQVNLAINALRNLNYARSLAEPNLVALNGQTAYFQAGGQFPVPVVTGFTASGLQGVSFVPFGVLVSFTPFITDKDRVRLNVAATVSTRDIASGTNIGGANVSGLTTRNFTTTVELREGQTLAVAGLIQTNAGAEVTRVPFIGDLPVLSSLTGFSKYTAGEQELVVLVTPELVHPMDRKEIPPLPGSDVYEPGDLEFYVCGRLEGRREYDYRSASMTDVHRMLRYYRCEQIYISGPHGFNPTGLLPPPPPPGAAVNGQIGPIIE